MKRLFSQHVLNFRYKLLNLRKLDLKKKAKSLTSQPILFILQNIWDLDENVVKELFSLNPKGSLRDKRFLMDRAVDYIRKYDPRFKWELLREIEEKTTKRRYIMPLLSSLEEAQEKGFQKGMQQGMQQGRQEGVQEGMQQGMQQGMRQGMQQGMRQGMQQGMRQGMQQGMRQGLSQVISGMLKRKLDIPLISSVTGLPEKEISKLKSKLKKL